MCSVQVLCIAHISVLCISFVNMLIKFRNFPVCVVRYYVLLLVLILHVYDKLKYENLFRRVKHIVVGKHERKGEERLSLVELDCCIKDGILSETFILVTSDI